MGGPSTSAETATANAQSQIGAQSAAQSQADRQRALDLQQPLITKEQALAWGDAESALRAAMPQITQISQGYKQAKDSIFATIPPGASRDAALANLNAQASNAPAAVMGTQVASAPEVLANVGSGLGAFSLQELGAGLSGYQGASTTQSNVVNQQNQAKGNTLGFLGSLAGAGGYAAGSALGKPSDRRLKTRFSELTTELALARGMHIQVMRYAYKDAPLEQRIGVMAQDVREVFPQLVSEREDGMLTVDYGGLAAVTLAMVQELAGIVRQQEQVIRGLQAAQRLVEA